MVAGAQVLWAWLGCLVLIVSFKFGLFLLKGQAEPSLGLGGKRFRSKVKLGHLGLII